MKFKFVNVNSKGETFKFVGSSSTGTKRKEARNLRKDLGACLVSMAQEWEKEPIDLNEAKNLVLACIEQVGLEGGSPEEWRRMKIIISQVEETDDLVKYIYNFMLRASGLSVNKVMGGR
jgi:hypothetical protein